MAKDGNFKFEGGELKFEVGNKAEYLWDGKMFVQKDAAGAVTKTLELDKNFAHAFTTAIKDVKDGGRLKADEFQKLVDVVTRHEAFLNGYPDAKKAKKFIIQTQDFRDKIKVVKAEAIIYTQAEKDTAAAAGKKLKEFKVSDNIKDVKKLLADSKISKQFIPAAEFEVFEKELKKAGTTFDKIETSVGHVRDFANEVKDFKFNEGSSKEARKELHTILAKYHSKKNPVNELAEFLPESVERHLERAGFTPTSAFQTFTDDAKKAGNKLEDYAKKIAAHEEKIDGFKDKWFPDGKALAKEEKRLADTKAEVIKYLGKDPVHAAGSVHIDSKSLKILKDHSDIASALDSAASKVGTAVANDAKVAATSGRGFFTKLFEFKRTPEFASEQAAKNNMASGAAYLEKEGKALGSTRWGKVVGAGVIAGGAVLATVSALGNKGPGPNAQAEMARRDQAQEPAMAGGRA